MTVPHHPHEVVANAVRDRAARFEPRSLRTFTPTQAVISRSAGVYHWTADGRRLYDFTSGVLVANLGHNPVAWKERFDGYLGWKPKEANGQAPPPGYFFALPMTAYNAVTGLEVDASQRLAALMQSRPGGKRMEQVLWAASGSEAVQKGLWAALARDRTREMIIATRFGFHGKKGLATAVTGSETDRDRDPRVKFISFPMKECNDVTLRDAEFDPLPYRRELEALWSQYGRRFCALITEPYLGGGGSYHPPKAYLHMLQEFCREHDLVFLLDEVQANFGRTGDLFAYETYGIEPDAVVLGKGLGNGVPVAAVVGRADLFASLDYGEASDTWSANPICCAAVLATLDGFAERDVLAHSRTASALIEAGLVRLKELPFVAAVRGERGGMVWGVETRDFGDRTAGEWANALILAAYRGRPGVADGDGVHLLGALAKKVVRFSPPLTITEAEVRSALEILHEALAALGTATVR
jgi:4-aminobutyrate aminotransferase-like enzyme